MLVGKTLPNFTTWCCCSKLVGYWRFDSRSCKCSHLPHESVQHEPVQHTLTIPVDCALLLPHASLCLERVRAATLLFFVASAFRAAEATAANTVLAGELSVAM